MFFSGHARIFQFLHHRAITFSSVRFWILGVRSFNSHELSAASIIGPGYLLISSMKELAPFSHHVGRKRKRRRRTELTQVMAYARSNPYCSSVGYFALAAFWAARRFLTASAKQIGNVNAERRCGAFQRLKGRNNKATLNLRYMGAHRAHGIGKLPLTKFPFFPEIANCSADALGKRLGRKCSAVRQR